MMHRFDPTVLREYDIRGVVHRTLHIVDARAIGQAFGTVVARQHGRGGRICVGYDGRTTSPELARALVEGLAGTGAQVTRIGLGPTPLLYFSVFHRGADAGVMVTGSHNPSDQNGFKLMLGRLAYYGKDIARLGTMCAAGDILSAPGDIGDADVMPAYIDALVQGYGAPSGRSLAVAWDPGNGAAGPAIAALVRRLPGRHILINETVDGTFPAHHPDPSEEKNMVQIRDLVRRERCDVGLAFDGDGDRLGVVDSAGNIIASDMVLALLAREVLRERPGATIIADVKSSQILFDEVARLGGRPLMWRTGHAPIKAKLAETRAPLAGELSGHLFFADRYFGFDDALYAAVRVLAMIANAKQPLVALAETLPRAASTPEIRIFCPDERKFAVMDQLRDQVRQSGAKVTEIDGVRVGTPDGWWLVRASNTQPALVARAEAKDKAALANTRHSLEVALQRCGVTLPTD